MTRPIALLLVLASAGCSSADTTPNPVTPGGEGPDASSPSGDAGGAGGGDAGAGGGDASVDAVDGSGGGGEVDGSDAPGDESDAAASSDATDAATSPDAADASTVTTAVTGISVSGGDLVPAFAPGVFEYELTSLTNLFPVSITVTGADVTIGGTAVAAGTPYAMTVPSLDDATSISIVAKDTDGGDATYVIHSVPKNRATYTTPVVDAPKPGLIFVAPILSTITTKPNFIYVLDQSGALRFYRTIDTMAFDFKQQILTNGTKRYTYIQLDAPKFGKTANPGTVHVLDDQFREIRTVRLAATASHAAFGADVHEFVLLDDDHWFVAASMVETVDNIPGKPATDVLSVIVQEVSAGQVVFDWDSTSVPALYAQSTATWGGTVATDYVHFNSIDVDPATGGVVVSLRHLDEVIELDRASAAISWTLGGTGDDFGLAAADKFSHQHFARFLAPGDLLLFDNGNGTGISKIREYQIDPATHAATDVATVTVDAHYSSAMGSVQKIGGAYFVGWGSRATKDTDVTELDATTQKKSFELSFDDGYVSYRAFKFQ